MALKKRNIRTIPRIDIKKTVTNDIHLILNYLLPTNEIGRLIRNYDTFLLDHLAEMRLLNQVINQKNGDSENRTIKEKATANRNTEYEEFMKISWLTGKGSLLR